MLDALPERIRSKIKTDESTGCWLWTAATDRRGYGRVRNIEERRVVFAHRLVFQLLRYDPVGLDLDHLCRAPRCVNPDHMEAVTHLENVRRGFSSATLRRKYAEHLWCPKGHPLFGDNLYAHINKRGYVNKQCRTCRAESTRARNARLKAERATKVPYTPQRDRVGRFGTK